MRRRLRPGEGSPLNLVTESWSHRGWRAKLRDVSKRGLHTLAFVVVPNLPYALLVTEYDLRLRAPLVLLYWSVGVVAPKCPYWLVACAMAVIVSVDLTWLVSGLLFMHPAWVVESLRYAPLTYPAASSLYLAIGAGAIAAVVVPAWLVHRQRVWLLRGRGLAVALMLAIVAADLWLAIDPSTERPAFDSAMQQAGVEQSDAVRRNGPLLVVMVENLGVLADPAHNAHLFEDLRSDEIRARYRVREGVSPYAGMTTGATSRELCGRWSTWTDWLAGAAADCLPARLAGRGYETYAVHAYTERMFDRRDWYPKLGFEHLVFEGQMRARGEEGVCGTVFRSACDHAAADIVRELLTTPSERPRFVYWLTVDSHMPIDPADGTPRWDCTSSGGPFGNETVCLIARIWADVIDATVEIATDPELPRATTVLLVGDHPPGFVSRTVQRHFVPGIVPWIALEPQVPKR